MGKIVASLRKALWSTRTRQVVTSVVVILFFAGIILRFVAPVPPPHVSLSGEPIFSNGPAWLTNSFLTTLIVDAILIALALVTRFTMKEVPSGIQNFAEWVVESLYGLAESVAGRNAGKFFPWAGTIFLLVILSNWSGLIPGVGSIGFYHPVEPVPSETQPEQPAGNTTGFRWDSQLAMAGGEMILAAPETAIQAAPAAAETENEKFVPLFRAPSADLNMTFALALTTMIMVQVWGVRFLGGSYFRKFFNASGPNGFMKGVSVYVGILELISEFARILSFGFRLFGNVFAGEIILATMAFLFMFMLPVPFYALEVFIGFVQALVFTMLTLVFFHIATLSHGDDHGEHH